MTASNVDPELVKYRDRLIELEQEKRDRAEDIREVAVEMKSAGLQKHEIAGVKLAVKRHFEEAAKKALRESAEEVAAALGPLVGTPLGNAATA